jgi:hypothetical protein
MLMKRFLPALAILLSHPVFCQYTLTQTNHAPANGDTYEMFTGTVAVPGPAGANVVWDFSGLVTSTAVSGYTAVTTTNANYPNANVTVNGPASENAHYKSTAGELMFYGGNINAGTISGTMTYTNPAVEAKYPMSLNTTSTAPTSGSMQVTSPPIAATFTGTSHVIADGTGTIILPGGGTYTDVIRVVASQSFVANAGFVSANIERHLYNYYAPTIKAPVVSVALISATVTGSGASTNTIVMRNKNAPGVIPTVTVGISETGADAGIIVSPNPTADRIIFSNVSDASKLRMFDLTGKQVAATAVHSAACVVDAAELPAGVYIYTAEDEQGNIVGTGKVVVTH